MAINPVTGMEEDEDSSSVTPDMVNDYIKNKYSLGSEYSPEARQAIVDQNEKESSGPHWAAGLAAFGAGLQGQNAAEAGARFNSQEAAQRNDRLNQFDRKRGLALQDRELAMKDEQTAKKNALLAKEMDPNSDESKIAQDLFLKLGGSPEMAPKMTASKFKQFSPSLEKSYQIAQQAQTNKDNRLARSEDNKYRYDALAASKEDKSDQRKEMAAEKQQALQTPFGLANSLDDAKELKSAHESKKNFDNKIKEMISLREKHGGGANSLTNSEDVARGEQLSKDLLLEYKNMAKLGVLSASDEKIINAIIPKDPLAYNGLGATMTGQDPILNNLKKFKADSDKDFATRVATRTRDSGAAFSQSKPDEGSSTVRMVDPNGVIRQIPKDQVKQALAAGGKLADESRAIANEE